jgi:hypothetical protein
MGGIMNRLSLRMKLALMFLMSLTLIFCAMVSINYFNQRKTIVDYAEEDSNNIKWLVGEQIKSMMITGTNDRLQPFLEGTDSLGMTHEISVLNEDQVIARSTNKA